MLWCQHYIYVNAELTNATNMTNFTSATPVVRTPGACREMVLQQFFELDTPHQLSPLFYHNKYKPEMSRPIQTLAALPALIW